MLTVKSYIGTFRTLLDQSDLRSGTNCCIKFYNYSFLDVQLFLWDVIIELDSGDYSDRFTENMRMKPTDKYIMCLGTTSQTVLFPLLSTAGCYLNQTSQKTQTQAWWCFFTCSEQIYTYTESLLRVKQFILCVLTVSPHQLLKLRWQERKIGWEQIVQTHKPQRRETTNETYNDFINHKWDHNH